MLTAIQQAPLLRHIQHFGTVAGGLHDMIVVGFGCYGPLAYVLLRGHTAAARLREVVCCAYDGFPNSHRGRDSWADIQSISTPTLRRRRVRRSRFFQWLDRFGNRELRIRTVTSRTWQVGR